VDVKQIYPSSTKCLCHALRLRKMVMFLEFQMKNVNSEQSYKKITKIPNTLCSVNLFSSITHGDGRKVTTSILCVHFLNFMGKL